MGFGEAVKTVFGKYATFSGRARRSEFWWWVLFVSIVAFVLYVIDTLLGWKYGNSNWTMTVNGETSVAEGPKPFGILQTIWALAVLIPGLAVQVRRLHDSGKSGWWWWLNVFCCVGGIILFIFFLQPSQQGDNKYGQQPV